MTMVEMDLRFPRAATAKVSFAPPIIHLALFGSIAHNNQVIPISESSSTITNRLVKGNVTHVQRLFPDIPGCFEFNTSGVKMNSVGVFCKEKLAKGSVLGPYLGQKVSLEEVEKCSSTCKEGLWEIYKDDKVQWYIDGSNPSHKNWMYFIQSARNEEEQTLSAVQYGEILYFKALRDIQAGEELLVWYDKTQYELYMGLPTAFHQMVPLKQRSQGSSHSSSSEEEECDKEDKEVDEEEVETDCVSVDSEENAPVDIEKVDDDTDDEATRTEEENSRKRQVTLEPKNFTKRQKLIEPVYAHNPLVPGGLQLHKPFLYSPVSLPLQAAHHLNPTPRILTTVYPLPMPPTQWLKQAHSPSTPPHPLVSPVPVSVTKAHTMPCPWPCRPLHPHPTTLSPRQDDKFMFVRLADSTHWQCKLCNRVFTSQGSLRAHARIHNNEKPYRCKYCQRPFTQASTLRSHERLHTGEKPYKCDTCNKTFTQSAGLRSHKKTHTTR